MRTRRRSDLLDVSRRPTSNQILYTWNGVKWVYSTTRYFYYTPSSSYPYRKYERTTDELHKGPPYKTGGPFDNIRIDGSSYKTMSPIDSVIGIVKNTKYIISGSPILIYNPWLITTSPDTRISQIQTLIDDTLGSLNSHAQGMYSKFSPLKPRVDLGQFFAEFGEIPRMLASSARSFAKTWRAMGGRKSTFGPKHVANEWLNTQFGWVPFLSTIVDLYNTIKNLEQTLDRLRKYNGQWETRGGRISTIVNPNCGGTGTCSYAFPADSRFTTQFRSKVTRYATRDEWFSAKYRYYIPELRSVRYPSRLIREIMGLRISPQLVWDLIPFSWLADWFVNMGDILSRADDNQSYQLVTKDAYAMGRSILSDKVEASLTVSGSQGSSTSYLTAAFPVIRQERIRGTPYGFGVHSSDLSPWRVSILASLGVSFTRH